jgi:biopolymer transport protein ExbD
MNLRKHLRADKDPHTSALNDILFILLFFFLIISTLANPNLVKVTNPKAATDTKARQTVVVTVDSMQRFFVGTRLTAPDSLAAAISAQVSRSTDADPTIVINGDVNAHWGEVMLALRAAKSLNLKAVVAVEKESR